VRSALRPRSPARRRRRLNIQPAGRQRSTCGAETICTVLARSSAAGRRRASRRGRQRSGFAACALWGTGFDENGIEFDENGIEIACDRSDFASLAIVFPSNLSELA
jgi:hypothetical protein